MSESTKNNRPGKTNWFKRVFERLDQMMKEKANHSQCCGGKEKQEEKGNDGHSHGDSCCQHEKPQDRPGGCC